MSILKKLFNHLRTVLIHKWYVFIYMCKCGYIWRGIIHDISKFSWTEFSESIKYYNGKISPIDICKKENGYSLAWLHHKGHNKHHYEYWIDYLDDGGKAIEMPRKYAIELICDWIAAGRTYSHNIRKKFTYEDELEYVKWKLSIAKMHENTKKYVLNCFTHFAELNNFDPSYIHNHIIN